MNEGCFKSADGRAAVQDFYRGILQRVSFRFQTRELGTSHGLTHIIEAGPEGADVLLLLHGTCSNSASWLGDIPVWSRDHRVIAADMPGEPGLSEDRRLILHGDDVSNWLHSLLDGLALDRVRIVGMSLGGWAAVDFASRFPDKVGALALIAPAGLAKQRSSFVLKALPLLALGDWGLEHINRLVYHNTEVPREVHDFGRLVAKHVRPVTEAVPVFSDARLRRLQMPIKYLGGLHDALLDSEKSAARLSELVPHAEIRLLADTGHAILGQADAILEFLTKHKN